MSKQYEKDPLGCRMKKYEAVPKLYLTLGVPHVIRVDMRAGHTFCKHFDRPFDEIFSKAMIKTAIALCEQIPGVRFAYTQSDEISLALNDCIEKDGHDDYTCFFDGNIEKIVSISASIATLEFNKAYMEIVNEEFGDEFTEDSRILDLNPKVKMYHNNFMKAMFDSRVFSVPNEVELHNYFVWREQDAIRNSILSVGYANFSQNEMYGLNCKEIKNKLASEKDIKWEEFDVKYQRGSIIAKIEYKRNVIWKDKNGESHSEPCVRSKWSDIIEMPILVENTNFIPELYKHKLV